MGRWHRKHRKFEDFHQPKKSYGWLWVILIIGCIIAVANNEVEITPDEEVEITYQNPYNNFTPSDLFFGNVNNRIGETINLYGVCRYWSKESLREEGWEVYDNMATIRILPLESRVGVDILQNRRCLITGVIERELRGFGYWEHWVKELEQ